MAQESQHECDRDCLIAATLAAEGERTAEGMVNRFKEILEAIRKAGGTHEMWLDADPKGRGPKMVIV
jgi:hypothetical protein